MDFSLRCPQCGSDQAKRSHRRSLREYLAGALQFLPYRCMQCEHRFFSCRAFLQRLVHAHCPRCGNQELEPIPATAVPRAPFLALSSALNRAAYRCDVCRWRFFDSRLLAPAAQPSPASQAPGTIPAEVFTHKEGASR